MIPITHLFIINPAAGSRDRTEYYRQQIEAAFDEHREPYRIAVSEGPGDCCRITNSAARTGEEYRIYACGGDGTLNEVVQGAAGFPNVSVTVFSGGSGNDFVKIFDDPKAFFDISKLLDAEEATFDLIRCNDEIAMNICSVGLDARIAKDVSNYKRIPLLHGFRAYVASTVINLFKGIAEHYTVEIEGQTFDGDHTFVCVCNGRFYGGGFNPVPEADPTDGLLDVLLVKRVNLLQVPGIIGKYKNGQYRELPHLVRHFRTKEIHIHFDKPTSINLDGETRLAESARMCVAEEKLRFFYPRGLTWAAKIPATV